MVVQHEIVRRIAENRRLIDDLIKPEVYPPTASPVPAPVALNDMLIADATPVWAILTGPAGQGEILVAGAAPFTQTWATVDLLSLTHGDTTPQAVSRGSIIYGDAGPTWNELVIGALSTHLESDGVDVAWQANITMADDTWIGLGPGTARILFDDTPAGDAITFENCTHVGIDNLLEHNGDLDTYLIFSPDFAAFRVGNVDMLQMQELAAAQDNVTINATQADVDFVVEALALANAFWLEGLTGAIVVTGPSLTVPDDWWEGLGAGAGRVVFDATPAPDQVQIADADLNFVTAAHGIIHVDGVALGSVLRADGTRYVPASAVATVPLPPVAQNDMLIADAVPEWSILTGPAAQGDVLIAGAAPLTPAWSTVFTANMTFDDGVLDSPSLGFVGASNDQALLHFDDTARSLVITLEDDKAEAMRIIDDGGADDYITIVSTNAQREVVVNQDGADIDARFEAIGITHALFVQASDGKVGINTATISHGGIGYAMLALDGADTSANGPHVQFTTASDDYPLLQILPYAHDSINISFDSYLAGGGWLSSDVGSNFQIVKTGDLLQFRYDSGIAQGAVITWNPGMVLTATGGVGIETGAVPHGGIGYAKFAIDGLDVSALGPHVQFTTTADDYPLLQILPYGHDNVNINFDSYLAGGGWLSSDVGSNFQIIKTSDLLQFRYDSGIAQGAVITWNLGLAMAVTGNVGIADGAPTEGRLSIINNVADNGAIAYLYRDQATVNQSGFYMHLDNVADDEAAMTIRHDGTGDLFQLFDGAVQVVDIDNAGHLFLNSTTGLTGHTLFVQRALASGSTDNAVVSFTNTAAGDDQSVLWITQYSPAIGLDVAMFAADSAAYFSRDVDAAVQPVVVVVQDHATAATPVVEFQQDDISEGFINFVGSDRGVIGSGTSSLASVRVELGGVIYRLALYADA